MQLQGPHDSVGTYFDAVYTHVLANGTIARGNFVMWDVTIAGVVTATTLGTYVIVSGAATVYGVGVATNAATAGQRVIACCYGVVDYAATDTNVAVGNQLECAAAGVVRPAAVTTITASAGVMDKVGVALATDVGAVGKIFVRCM